MIYPKLTDAVCSDAVTNISQVSILSGHGAHHTLAAGIFMRTAPSLPSQSNPSQMVERKPTLFVFSMVILFVFAIFSFGTAEPENADTSLSLAKMFSIDVPTVVTSIMQEQRLSDAPSPMFVVTAEDIKKRGYYTLKDIMDDVPGFADLSDANENVAIVRGSYASTTNKLLILIDGHRMNDFNLGRYNVDQFLGVDAVNRIEFIQGPGSALYGTGALLGVINIITKTGAGVNGLSVRTKVGSFNREAYFSYGKKVSETSEVFCNVSFNDAPGAEVVMPASWLDTIPPGRDSADGNVYWNKYPSNYAMMASFKSEYITVRMRNEHYVRATPRSPNHSYYDWEKEKWKPQYNVDQTFIDVKTNMPLPFGDESKLVIQPSLHFYQLKEQSWISSFGANQLPDLGSRNGQFTDELRGGLKAYVQSQFSKSTNFVVGYDGNYTRFLQSMGHSLPDGEQITMTANYVNTGDLFFNGLFAQGIWNCDKLLSVNLGLRFDTFDSQGKPAFTPRFGIIYHPVQELSLKLLYGRSFLAPQWAHVETVEDAGKIFQSNSDLEPEIFEGFDLIADYSYDKLNVYLDVYYNKVSDIISLNIDKYINMGQAQYGGVDAGFKVVILNQLKFNGSLSYVNNFDADKKFMDANYTDGELRAVPPYIVRYGVEYSPIEGLYLLAWGRTYSEVAAFHPPDDNKINGWTSIDAAVNYSYMAFDVQFQIINVADNDYLIADNAGNRRPLPRYGRGFHGSVSYNFDL